MNLERTLTLWASLGGLFPRLCFAEVLECPSKWSCSSSEQMSRSLWVWRYPKRFTFWVFHPFSSSNVHVGLLRVRLMNRTGAEILGITGPGSTLLPGAVSQSCTFPAVTLSGEVRTVSVAWGWREEPLGSDRSLRPRGATSPVPTAVLSRWYRVQYLLNTLHIDNKHSVNVSYNCYS